MNVAALSLREAGYARKSLLRDPQSLFFTIALPLLYLFIFDTVFGSQVGTVPGQPGRMKISIVMTASVIVIGVVSSAFQNLTVTLIQDREQGILKRLRSTPVPTPVFLAGHLVNATITSVILAVGVGVLGITVYGVPFPGERIGAAVVTVLMGTLACAGAAIPFTRVVRKGSAASPVTVAVTLSLFFLSGNFFPGVAMPRLMGVVADIFPVRHFFSAMLTAFNPNTAGSGFDFGELGVLALWGVAGAALGTAVFRWTPSEDR